jgi:diacylglycerol kinase (ATP)
MVGDGIVTTHTVSRVAESLDASRVDRSVTTTGRRVLVIHNPTSGWRRVRRLDAVVKRLRQLGCAVIVRPTTGPHDATRLARVGVDEGFDVIAAAGGDGTINEIANAIPVGGPPLGIIPLGTANILAWEIGLGRGTERVARTIAEGMPRPIVVGRVGERTFLLMVGIGFDGAVVAGLSPMLKRWLGKGAYAIATVIQIGRYAWPMLSVRVDGASHACTMAIVTKAHYYAGRFVLATDAGPEEPLFRVCLFRRGGAWNLLRYGVALLRGRLARLPDVSILPAREVTVEKLPLVAVQTDGESLGTTPTEISIVEEQLVVLWPVGR